MLSLAVTGEQRKRDNDKERGEEGEITMLMIGLKLIIELKTIEAITLLIFHVGSKLAILPPTTKSLI